MKKLDFDKLKYVDNAYLKDGKAIIKVNVDNNEFYNEYDSTNQTMKPGLIEYITSEAHYIPYDYDIVIDIRTSKISNQEKENITKIIRDYYALKALDKSYSIKSNYLKSIWLFILGILIIVASFILEATINKVALEVLSVAGWVVLWESIDIFLLSNNKNKIIRKNYVQLYNSEIIFSEKSK